MSQLKINKLSEVAFPAILTATSLGYLIYSLLLGAPISKGLPSPLFFPTVLGSSALVLSTILLYRAILSFKNSSLETSKKETATKETTRRPALIVIATIAYISIFSYAGYFISSSLYLFFIISIFSSIKKPIIAAIGSIIITTMGLVVFEHIFRIRLPGILG